MSLSLIVFDCDGIILESIDAKSKAFYRIGLNFGKEAAEQFLHYHQLHGGVSRYLKFDWLYETYAGRTVTEAEKEELNSQFVSIALDEVQKSVLVPGIMETLEHWHKRVPMYVASGTPQQELATVLSLRKLDHFFAGIYGSPPGKTELLREIIRVSGFNPTACVMIGDSSTDQYAAEAVGTLFYGRGEYFKHSGHPWHHDLTALNDYLEELD